MTDPEAAKYVSGVAFHWYGGFLKNYDALSAIHKAFPSLPLVGTEATLEARWKQLHPWTQGSYYAVDIINDFNNFGQAWIEWNVLLNEEGEITRQLMARLSSCHWVAVSALTVAFHVIRQGGRSMR